MPLENKYICKLIPSSPNKDFIFCLSSLVIRTQASVNVSLTI